MSIIEQQQLPVLDAPLVAPRRLAERVGPVAVGLVVAAAVVYPWAGRGWLLVVDWVHGPHSGLGAGAGIAAASQPSLPLALVQEAADRVAGTATVSWAAVAVTLVLAAWAAGRAVPGGAVAKTAAAALYTVNPFVFERIGAGQVFFLAGYALLPLVARSLVVAERYRGWRRWAPAAWAAAAGAASVHFLWISAVLVVALVVWRHRTSTLLWAGGILALVVVLDAYLIVPALLQHPVVAVGANDLAAYRTRGDPTLGLYANVAGLYGFWRTGPTLPKAHLAGWPILALAVLMVAGRGAWRARRDPGRRDLAGMLVLATVLGFFLALGDQGPTGGLFRLLYFHLPGFAVMREPEKFSALLALGYAVCFGLGAESLIPGREARARLGTAAVAVGVAVAYTPTLFGGLGGQISTSHYPASWRKADQVMGSGPGKILFLPLHDYLSFAFTGGRIVANPGPAAFRRSVLVGGQVEAGPVQSDSLSPEDAYLEYLVRHGPQIHELGHLVAQLGVRYIVLARTPEYSSYSWVARQRDLVLVYHSPSLAVYRNPLAQPEGARLPAVLPLPSTACYVDLAQSLDLTGTAVVVRPSSPCAAPAWFVPPSPVAGVRRTSEVSYHASAGPGGMVVIPQAADSAWELGGAAGQALVDGVVGVAAGPAAGTVSYRWWWATPTADGLSAVVLAVLVAGCLIAGRRRPSGPEDTAAAPEHQRSES